MNAVIMQRLIQMIAKVELILWETASCGDLVDNVVM